MSKHDLNSLTPAQAYRLGLQRALEAMVAAGVATLKEVPLVAYRLAENGHTPVVVEIDEISGKIRVLPAGIKT